MKYNDFLLLEKELNIKLPENYKKFVLMEPFKDKRFNKINNVLFDDIETLIRVNKKIRENGYYKKKWNKNLFIIGGYENDNIFYLIKLNDKKQGVFSIMPDDQTDKKRVKVKILGKDYNEFVNNIIIVIECL